jgi:hypothetical protein
MTGAAATARNWAANIDVKSTRLIIVVFTLVIELDFFEASLQ